MSKAAGTAPSPDKRIQTTRDVRCGARDPGRLLSNTYIPRQTYKASVVWLSAPHRHAGDAEREGNYTDRSGS